MSVNAISRGIVLYFIMIFSVVAMLNATEFTFTERQFTTIMVAGMLIVGIYTGAKANSYFR